jgi:sugar-specific transcriptional regulator TrmB
MAENVIEELKEFLKLSKISNYEIDAFMTLLNSNVLTAREISEKSGVPTGRIYEVLQKLKESGMIEIQESRPKMYRTRSLSLAFNSLISHLNNKHQDKISNLYNQAKILESQLHKTNYLVRQDSSKIFWSTAFGYPDIFSLYLNNFEDLQDELLMTGFINENTIKILHYAQNFYEGIKNAWNRGVQVKYLWSFEYDERPLLDKQKVRNCILFEKLMKKFDELFKISSKMDDFQMKFIHRKIPSYYDIFDQKRIMIKLQNPSNPAQIFACMNIFDPTLAKELRKKFHVIWILEAMETRPNVSPEKNVLI